MASQSLIIGNFDGVHKGHQYLLSEFTQQSKKMGLEPVILTYTEHPSFVLNKKEESFLLMSYSRRNELLQQYAKVIELNFLDIMSLKAKEFLDYLEENYPKVKNLYLGFNSSIGKDKLTHVEHKIKVFTLDRFSKFEVSSSLLRNKIKQGKLDEYELLSNRAFEISGKVVKGKQLGATIGFPTANLDYSKKLMLPPNAVYWGTTKIDDKTYAFMANIGQRPSVDHSKETIVEAHILDYNADLYGKNLRLSLKDKLRGIKKFDSLADLQKQLEKDKAQVNEKLL